MIAEYVYAWEFQVKAAMRVQFEREYGPAGSWVQLFDRASGYLGTALLRDLADPARYITIDRWRSASDYRDFRARFATQYAELDRRCERLTERETSLGSFSEAGAAV